MSQLTEKQQEEIQTLQAMTQQLQTLQQSGAHMDSALKESQRALAAIQDLSDDADVYRASGALFFKTTIPEQKAKLTEDIELLEVRYKTTQAQAEDLEKRAKELDAKLRAEIGI